MVSPEIQVVLEKSAHEVLVWVGFGTLVGLAGKAIMPGRDPGGAVATLMTGATPKTSGMKVVLALIMVVRMPTTSPWRPGGEAA